MSHTVKVNLIANSHIVVNGNEYYIHDIKSIVVENDKIMEVRNMCPVEQMRIDEEQSRYGHIFKRISANCFEVDTSTGKNKNFEIMDLYQAINFYYKIKG